MTGEPVRRFQPLPEPQPLRFREKHRLVCPRGCEMRMRRERIVGGIHTCEKCSTKFVVLGIIEAPNGRDYYAVGHVTRAHVEHLDHSAGMSTFDDLLDVLGLS